MPNKTDIELNESWVCEHLSDVTDIETKKVAWVLVQEPGFIGFGVVFPNEICWPPYLKKLDWERVSDLRLFGKSGEWHVWPDWDGKHQCRLLEFREKGEWNIWLGPEGKQQSCPEKNGEKINTLTEYHALWGNDVKPEKSPWIKLVEERGAEIWLPLEKFKLEAKSDLPLRLKLKQIVDYDFKYHLAGIVDSALIGLVRSPNAKKDDELLLPTDLSSCS